MPNGRYPPRSLLIALALATLVHVALILGIRVELPKAGQAGRASITMLLVRPAPAVNTPQEGADRPVETVATPVEIGPKAPEPGVPGSPVPPPAPSALPDTVRPPEQTAKSSRPQARPKQPDSPRTAAARPPPASPPRTAAPQSRPTAPRPERPGTPPASGPLDAPAPRSKEPTPAPSSRPGITRRLDLSADLLSQQIAEVSADLTRQHNAELQDKNIVYTSAVKSHRPVVAAYEQAWREKVERIGNLNYPDEARRENLSGRLLLAVGIKPDGSVYSIQVQHSSGHAALDNAARRIVELAAPFAPLPAELREEVDILVITRTWRFESDYRLETQ